MNTGQIPRRQGLQCEQEVRRGGPRRIPGM